MSDWNSTLVTELPRSGGLQRTLVGSTRRVYDAVAAIYPASTFFFHSRAHKAALEMSGIRDGMKVLEIATGSGEMFRRLLEVNPSGQTFGLDLSPNMAAKTQARARQEFHGVGAHCGAVDVRNLPFRAASFDAVMCCFLIELLCDQDIAATLREVRRVLRPGAKFTLVVIGQNRTGFNRAYRIAGGLAPAFWGRQVEKDTEQYLRAAGLSVTDSRYVQQGFYPSRVLVAG